MYLIVAWLLFITNLGDIPMQEPSVQLRNNMEVMRTASGANRYRALILHQKCPHMTVLSFITAINMKLDEYN